MRNNCHASTNSKTFWDGASTISPTFLTPKRNKRLNWERNLSFPGQHYNREDTSNSFCKELQCTLLDDGFHTNNESVSYHETTKCWTHEKWGILSGKHPFNHYHHEALIVFLPCVIPSFLMKYWTIDSWLFGQITSSCSLRMFLILFKKIFQGKKIDIHGCESKHILQ